MVSLADHELAASTFASSFLISAASLRMIMLRIDRAIWLTSSLMSLICATFGTRSSTTSVSQMPSAAAIATARRMFGISPRKRRAMAGCRAENQLSSASWRRASIAVMNVFLASPACSACSRPNSRMAGSSS